MEVRWGRGFVGVVVLLRLHKAGRRAARNDANRDCELGKEGSDTDVGSELDDAFRLEVDGAGDAVRMARRSSSRSAALSTINRG